MKPHRDITLGFGGTEPPDGIYRPTYIIKKIGELFEKYIKSNKSLEDSMECQSEIQILIEDYGQQQRDLQHKKDDLVVHTAYNSGYEDGKKESNQWIPVSEIPKSYLDLWIASDIASENNTVHIGYYDGKKYLDAEGWPIDASHYIIMNKPAPPTK